MQPILLVYCGVMETAGRGQSAVPLVGALFGRYRLERLLGEGGMGVVYAARHEDLGRFAAVKILNERYDASAQSRARLLREGQATSRIGHPNIVDVYDVGTEGDRAFLVMELLHGEDLRALLDREGPLSVERAADLLVPVMSALMAAHELGVVHRDLKPENIFLSIARGRMVPKVLDFGISKLLEEERDASLTSTGALLGTPYYMSPEQAQATGGVDARSDQYSLGVIIYECVTGHRPIEERSIYRLLQRIVHSDFAPPRQLKPDLPSAFEQLILTAMARAPSERFTCVRQLTRALLEFASERVRANYADELSREAAQPPARTALTQHVVETLVESAVQGRPSRPAGIRHTRRVLGGSGGAWRYWVVVCAAAGILAVLLVRSWVGRMRPEPALIQPHLAREPLLPLERAYPEPTPGGFSLEQTTQPSVPEHTQAEEQAVSSPQAAPSEVIKAAPQSRPHATPVSNARDRLDPGASRSVPGKAQAAETTGSRSGRILPEEL